MQKIDDGMEITNFIGVQNLILQYFQNIYASNNSLSILQERVINKVLSNEDITLLANPFTQEEIVMTIKQMKVRKPPGQDCLQAYFLQKYQNVIGSKVTSMTLCILNEGKDISSTNDIYIFLIPKFKNLSHVKYLRLISLCNASWKLFQKLLLTNFILPCLLSSMIVKVLLLKICLLLIM